MSVKRMIQELVGLIEIGDESYFDEEMTRDCIKDMSSRKISEDILADPDFWSLVMPVYEGVKPGVEFRKIEDIITQSFDEYYKRHPVQYTIFLSDQRGKKMDPNSWPGRLRIRSPPRFRIEAEGEIRYLTTMLDEQEPKVYYSTFMNKSNPLRTVDMKKAVLECEDYKIVRQRYQKSRYAKKLRKKQTSPTTGP